MAVAIAAFRYRQGILIITALSRYLFLVRRLYRPTESFTDFIRGISAPPTSTSILQGA